MDPEKIKRIKEYFNKLYPNRKLWILDPDSMTEAEMKETVNEIKEHAKKLKEEQDKIDKLKRIFLN